MFRPTTLTAGVFRIISSTGRIEPGKTQRINVYCVPNIVQKFEETVMIILKEGNAQERKGKPLLLTVDGAVPNVNLDDCRYIFQEVYVVETYNTADEIKQVGLFLKSIVFE